jgi:hypothetical protein
MNTVKQLSVISLAAVLSACGGGGDGSSSGSSNGDSSAPSTPAGPQYKTGTFVDSPVKGLRYTTPTKTGLTDSWGRFEYLEGETIRFTVGGIELGEAQGADKVTPFSLFEVLPPNKEEQIVSALLDNKAVRTLDKALNIAILLQNLDIDNNPENGINLGSADEELSETTLNIANHKALSFVSSAGIASLRNQVGLSGSPRQVQESMAHMYDSLQIDVEASSVDNVESASGLQEKSNTSFSYDEDGRVTEERIDVNGDGSPDFSKTYRYENGLLVETSNSKQQTRETLEYENGRITSRLTARDAGPDSRESYVYSGDLLTEFRFDADDDGNPEKIITYSHNAAGNVTETNVDLDGDGSIDSVTRNTYDPDHGKLTSYWEDKDNDTVPNLVISYSYDENGNRQSFEVKVDDNALPQSLSNFTYEGNRLKSYSYSSVDGGGNPNLQFSESYSYDSEGRRRSYKKDVDGDGNYDTYAQYKYDEQGNRVLSAEDLDGDGKADKIWRRQFNKKALRDPWDKIFSQL